MRTKHTFRLPPDLMGKLADYAARKGMSVAEVERWLAPVLNYTQAPAVAAFDS